MSIFTADGVPVRTEQIVPPEYLKMLLVLADTASGMALGLHCSKCRQDVRGVNSIGAGTLRMECACRTYIGTNPMRKERVQ